MNTIKSSFLHICGIAAFFSILAFANLPASAGQSSPELIAVGFSLNKPTLTLGEPLVLRYKISNVSQDYDVSSSVIVNKKDWCRLSLKDKQGNSVAGIQEVLTDNSRGLHSEPFETIAPATSDNDYLVASRFFKITHPGNYVLTVQVHAPYASVEDTEQSLLNIKKAIKNSGSIYTKTFEFPITIHDTNPTRTRKIAASIVQQLSTETDGKTIQYLLNALFSMPEAQCLSSWQAIARRPGMNASLISKKLSEIQSVQATDILAQMLDNPALTADERNFVSLRLNEMYNTSSPALRSHLKVLAAHRGVNLPETVSIPAISD